MNKKIVLVITCLLVVTLGACGNSQAMTNDNLETVKITLEKN